MLATLAKAFLIIGAVFLVLGGLIFIASRLNLPLGRLPGDITLQGKGFTCIFPIATSILLSILLTGILWILTRFLGRK
ncbi:MAG: DUF2905 domain-containing protein [Acidobacteriaceae bacterium]